MPKADLVEELRQGRGLRQDTQTDDICDEVAEVWLTREQVTLHAFRTAASKARTFTTIAAAFVASPPTQILDTARTLGDFPMQMPGTSQWRRAGFREARLAADVGAG